MKRLILFICLLVPFFFTTVSRSEPFSSEISATRPVSSLLGEKLRYNVSFLWFEKIARGEISLVAGRKSGTYLATLKVSTRGLAAFFTRNRVEIYTTLMEEGPDGLLQPLMQVSDTQKGKGKQITHRETSYAFDFVARQVIYRKSINNVAQKKLLLPMDKTKLTYDFLSAFYNLRLGRLGPITAGHDIKLSAFSRKGPEKIIIRRTPRAGGDLNGFSKDMILCQVLMPPETFKSRNRDVYVGFDPDLRPLRAVVKNVIGLGDVRGELIQVIKTGQQ